MFATFLHIRVCTPRTVHWGNCVDNIIGVKNKARPCPRDRVGRIRVGKHF